MNTYPLQGPLFEPLPASHSGRGCLKPECALYSFMLEQSSHPSYFHSYSLFQSCFWNVNCLLFLFLHSDYIQCPYCMRRFNETAANRHINFCKDQSSRRVFDPAQTAAKLASRTQVNISSQVLALMILHAWGKQVEFAREPQLPILRSIRSLSLILVGVGFFWGMLFTNSIFQCYEKNLSIEFEVSLDEDLNMFVW